MMTEHDQAGDRYYSPARIYALLREYHTLLVPRPRDDERPFKRGKRPNIDPEKNRADRKADLDRALGWLAAHDPRAAAMIHSYYIDLWRVEQVANAEGVSERTVYRDINRGVYAMSRFLGFAERREEAS